FPPSNPRTSTDSRRGPAIRRVTNKVLKDSTSGVVEKPQSERRRTDKTRIVPLSQMLELTASQRPPSHSSGVQHAPRSNRPSRPSVELPAPPPSHVSRSHIQHVLPGPMTMPAPVITS